MSSTYNNALRLEMISTGDQAGVWGNTTNTNLGALLVDSVAGYISVVIASANQALTVESGATDESRNAVIALTTSTGANFSVYLPPSSKQTTFYNTTAYTATIYNSTVAGNTTAAGSGVAIPANKTMTVWTDGTNVRLQNDAFIAPALGTPASGVLTNCTGLPIATGVSGLGTSVASALATNVGSAGAPVIQNGALGTPSSGTLTNCTFPTLNQNTTGSAASINTGSGWTVFQSGSYLYFQYGGVSKLRLDSGGNLVAAGNVTAYGSI